jgi:SpoVK/Ycf46/Vps4 family AAA+-type ATPase
MISQPTGNLIHAVDSAFLDRVDVKQFIPNPTPLASYEIFRSSLNELLRCGVIVNDKDKDAAVESIESRYADTDSGERYPITSDMPTIVSRIGYFPSSEEVNVFCYDGKKNLEAWKLWEIAEKCNGLSGRTLRRLPLLAVTMWTYCNPCPINDALEALSLVVDEGLGTDTGGIKKGSIR